MSANLIQFFITHYVKPVLAVKYCNEFFLWHTFSVAVSIGIQFVLAHQGGTHLLAYSLDNSADVVHFVSIGCLPSSITSLTGCRLPRGLWTAVCGGNARIKSDYAFICSVVQSHKLIVLIELTTMTELVYVINGKVYAISVNSMCLF